MKSLQFLDWIKSCFFRKNCHIENMAAQQLLFNIVDYGESHKKKKKRVRYKTPTYIKSYQFRVFNDETKQYQYYGDEKHILRIQTLHKLYSMIYGYCNINLFEQFERKEIKMDDNCSPHPNPPRPGREQIIDNCYTSIPPYLHTSIIVWGEDKQAEIANTWNLPLKDRVLLHLRLLRYLREGFSVRESLERVRNDKIN